MVIAVMTSLSVPTPTPSAKNRAVTLTAIAKQAGLSVSAVSCFFSGRLSSNGTGTIGLSAQAREKIVRASRELGYQPADPAMWVRLYPERGEFCYLFDRSVEEGIANPYHSRLFKGAASVLGEGRHLSFAQTDRAIDYVQEDGRLPLLIQGGAVSRCILAGAPNYSLILALQKRGMRIVYASQSVPLPGVVSVAPDYQSAAVAALGHLRSMGHRRVVVAAEPYLTAESFAFRELLAGTAAAFAEAGRDFAATDVLGNRAGEGDPGGGAAAVAAIVRAPASQRPTAVFCFDDWTALQVIRAAQASGLRVPADLSVVGVNDDQHSATLNVPLTTVRLPAEEIGARAVALLQENESPETTRRPFALYRLPVTLVERASVAPPRGA